MSKKSLKHTLFTKQTRAYIEGVVEQFNDQWVFFNIETEEASLLEERENKLLEIYDGQMWKKGYLLEDGQVQFSDGKIYVIKNHDHIRFQKDLFHSFDTLLSELSDDVFIQFVTSLNSLQFSIFDCIYCYNHDMFIRNKQGQTGVNFILFDNEESVCSVQHHFSYLEQNKQERFEFTMNNGKRMIVEKHIN